MQKIKETIESFIAYSSSILIIFSIVLSRDLNPSKQELEDPKKNNQIRKKTEIILCFIQHFIKNKFLSI